MSRLSYDDEGYFFQIADEVSENEVFVLIIYDIIDNKKRTKFSKLLEGYGKRVQKSAFEAIMSEKKYKHLLDIIPRYIDKSEDNVRIYRIVGRSKITSFGIYIEEDKDNVILI